MYKINVGDNVVVISGNDLGKKGKVLSINRKTSKAIVEGVREVKRSVKPNQANPEGGFVIKSLPIHLSNIAIFSEKAKKASRVTIESKSGKKTRVLKKCKTQLEYKKVK